MAITTPGTIEELVADAAGEGHRVTARMIRDWTQIGLLDYPRRRPAGRGHGSRQALYPVNQRKLFLALLSKRAAVTGVRSLARVPVWFWLYRGDEYVPLLQARRAFMTWLGDPRVSRDQARSSAIDVLGMLDHPNATATARRQLRDVLTRIAYTGQADEGALVTAVRAVFEPGFGSIRRAVGDPDAPVTVDAFVAVVKARLTAIRLFASDQVTDEMFVQARHAHRVHYADYAARQPQLAENAPRDQPNLYEPMTAERGLNECCTHLLTVIGLLVDHQRPVVTPEM